MRQPEQQVIMRTEPLCKFENPEETEARTLKPESPSCSSAEVHADAIKKSANVARACVASFAVGEREHRPSTT